MSRPISNHRQSRWYEEGPLKGPSVEAQLALVPILVEVLSLTEGPLAPGVLSSHSLGVHFTWDRLGPSGHGRPHVPRCLPRWGPSRTTPGTAEPVGVSPPEAVDSIGLKNCTLRADEEGWPKTPCREASKSRRFPAILPLFGAWPKSLVFLHTVQRHSRSKTSSANHFRSHITA